MKKLIAASAVAAIAGIFALASHTQSPEEVKPKEDISSDGERVTLKLNNPTEPQLETSPAFQVNNEMRELFLLPAVPDTAYTREMRDSDCGLYEVFYSPEAERKYIEEGHGKPDHGEYGKQFTDWAKRNCSHLSR